MIAYLLALAGLFSVQQKAVLQPVVNEPHRYFVAAEAKQTITAEELQKNYPPLAAYVKNGYTAYRLTYHTTNENGKDVIASGALFVPDSKADFPVLNYNHGTYFPSKERNAPSYLQGGQELNIGKLFAGAGYVVAMPDYIGYGSTKQEQHPYGAYSLIAHSSVDMLQAVNEFCKEQKLSLSGKYFFSGWSEGAAVALAAVKQLEEQKQGIIPTATVLNAGPYFSSGFAEHIINSTGELKYVNSYAWVLQTYNRLYNINRPLDYYFTQPAATDLAENPESPIPHDPNQLFNESFMKSYAAGSDTAIAKAMAANDLWNWKPASPIIFCHGDKDDYVPLFNSEKAYNEMLSRGADVELKVFKGQNHTSGVFGFLIAAFGSFEAKR